MKGIKKKQYWFERLLDYHWCLHLKNPEIIPKQKIKNDKNENILKKINYNDLINPKVVQPSILEKSMWKTI